MKHSRRLYLQVILIAFPVVLAGWGWSDALARYGDAPLCVYNSSNILDQYWLYRNKYGLGLRRA